MQNKRANPEPAYNFLFINYEINYYYEANKTNRIGKKYIKIK